MGLDNYTEPTITISATITTILVLSIVGLPYIMAESQYTSTFKITITNLTPGQPLTPPLIIAHDKGSMIFEPGVKASKELSQLAQNGDAKPLTEMLKGKVYDMVLGDAPLVPANDPGDTGLDYTQEFMIKVPKRVAYLSYVSMLVCTNDGFAGINNERLPYLEKTIYVYAYDARSETNTEDFADLVPPCQGAIGITSDDEGTGMSNSALSEDGIVIFHPGIFGMADLIPKVHDWNGPVAKIKVERIN